MTRDQRHYSDPFVCQENLLITECTKCLRRGSTSLVEMLRCRAHSLPKPVNPSSCLCPLQDMDSPIRIKSPLHDRDHLHSNAAQNPSPLSSFLHPHQLSHHDSASHFDSPHLPTNLQPHSELYLSVPRSPQSHHRHCRACMSLLYKDRAMGGGSLGHTHKHTSSTSSQCTTATKPCSPTPPHLSPPATLLASPSAPSANSHATLGTVPSHFSPSSPALRPRTLYEGGDLTLLNYCLHHIVSRRTSSPTLSDRGSFNQYVFEHVDKSQSLDVPLSCTRNLDRNLLLSSHYSEGRPDPLVGGDFMSAKYCQLS